MRTSGIRPSGKRSHLLGNTRVRKRKIQKERKITGLLPIRSAKKPVQVVFVCWEGFSSAGLSERFKALLKERGIKNISTRWLAFTNGLDPSRTRFVLKPTPVLKKSLRDADIVFHFDYPAFPKKYLQNLANGRPLFSPFLEPQDPTFRTTLALIEKHFDLR